MENKNSNFNFVKGDHKDCNNILKDGIDFNKIDSLISVDSLPVGIMATMLKNKKERNKELKQPFHPYELLDNEPIPQINMNEIPNSKALNKLAEFYQFYYKNLK